MAEAVRFIFKLALVFCVVVGKLNALNVTCALKNSAFASVTCFIQLHAPFSLSENEHINFTLPGTVTAAQIERVELAKSSTFRSTLFPVDIFNAFPNLRKITFPADIREIRSTDFTNATNLNYFILTNAHIEKIPSELFKKATNLTLVVLKNNGLQKVEEYAFYKLEKLEVLSLSENQIRNITKNMFSKLPALKALYLRDNQIESVADGSFDMPSLRQLSLNKNRLTVLSDKIFAGTPSLRVFSAGYNYIKNISNAFYGLQELRKLYLSVNRIIDLDIVKLAHLPQLEQVCLRDSGFNLGEKNITDADIAATKSSVKVLDLSENRINDGNILNKLKLFGQLEEVNLARNNFAIIELGLRAPQLRTIKFNGNLISFPDLHHLVMKYNMTITRDEQYIVVSDKSDHIDFVALEEKLLADSVYFI